MLNYFIRVFLVARLKKLIGFQYHAWAVGNHHKLQRVTHLVLWFWRPIILWQNIINLVLCVRLIWLLVGLSKFMFTVRKWAMVVILAFSFWLPEFTKLSLKIVIRHVHHSKHQFCRERLLIIKIKKYLRHFKALALLGHEQSGKRQFSDIAWSAPSACREQSCTFWSSSVALTEQVGDCAVRSLLGCMK